MPDSTTSELLSPIDGVPLHVRTWMPEGDQKGTLVIVHGLGEHGGRYDAFARAFGEAGWAVIAADHRGHGRSGGLRGHVDGFDQYVTDRGGGSAAGRARRGDAPVALWGHSMGALITLLATLDRKDLDLTSIIVSNPLIEVAVKAPKIKLAAGRILSRVLPRLRLSNEIPPEDISRDAAVVRDYEQDPLVHGLISTRWFTSMEAAREPMAGRASELVLPALAIISSGDRMCAPAAGTAFAKAAPGAELLTFEGAFHEPHNDLCRDEVKAALLAWLEKLANDATETVRYEAASE